MTKIKKKEAGNGPFFKQIYITITLNVKWGGGSHIVNLKLALTCVFKLQFSMRFNEQVVYNFGAIL